MLKKLFTSNTRIKLLTVFLLNPGEEYFIRELTRKLDEQINSIRRELNNLKQLGLLKSRVKNRKKYYVLNEDFIFLEELRSIFIKANATDDIIAKELAKIGNIELLVLSGLFINKPTESVDLLIVGEIDRDRLAHYLNHEIRTKRPVKFTVMTEADYKYRVNCHDQFIQDIVADPENQIPIKNL